MKIISNSFIFLFKLPKKKWKIFDYTSPLRFPYFCSLFRSVPFYQCSSRTVQSITNREFFIFPSLKWGYQYNFSSKTKSRNFWLGNFQLLQLVNPSNIFQSNEEFWTFTFSNFKKVSVLQSVKWFLKTWQLIVCNIIVISAFASLILLDNYPSHSMECLPEMPSDVTLLPHKMTPSPPNRLINLPMRKNKNGFEIP